MKKAMICQPMNGRDVKDIITEREILTKRLNSLGYDVVNTFFDFDQDYFNSNDIINIPLYYLAESISKMSECDAVYFCKGYEDYRGCDVEHYIAEKYGLEFIYEE